MTVGQFVRAVLMGLGTFASLAPATAQTRSTRDTTTAYGARLTADTAPAVANRHRVNNRIDNRLNNRIDLRIERYTPTVATDPGAAFTVSRDDGTRRSPIGTTSGLPSRTAISVGGLKTPAVQDDAAQDVPEK